MRTSPDDLLLPLGRQLRRKCLLWADCAAAIGCSDGFWAPAGLNCENFHSRYKVRTLGEDPGSVVRITGWEAALAGSLYHKMGRRIIENSDAGS